MHLTFGKLNKKKLVLKNIIILDSRHKSAQTFAGCEVDKICTNIQKTKKINYQYYYYYYLLFIRK